MRGEQSRAEDQKQPHFPELSSVRSPPLHQPHSLLCCARAETVVASVQHCQLNNHTTRSSVRACLATLQTDSSPAIAPAASLLDYEPPWQVHPT